MKQINPFLNAILHTLLVHLFEGQLHDLGEVHLLSLQHPVEPHAFALVLDHVDH